MSERPTVKRGRKRWLAAAGLVIALTTAVAVLSWPRTNVVEVFTQPSTITYQQDAGAHVAVLRHVHAFVGVDHYDVVLGRDRGGSYGHLVRLDMTGVDPTALTVEWTTEGAWLVLRSGHRVLVPADKIVGGR